jgi:hypothetical protein
MVKDQVIEHITKTNALQTGGMFIATSSEINPPIKLENYLSMIQTTAALTNSDFPPTKDSNHPNLSVRPEPVEGQPPFVLNESKDDLDDSLCSYCANQEECNGHHMMCIDYKPKG